MLGELSFGTPRATSADPGTFETMTTRHEPVWADVPCSERDVADWPCSSGCVARDERWNVTGVHGAAQHGSGQVSVGALGGGAPCTEGEGGRGQSSWRGVGP